MVSEIHHELGKGKDPRKEARYLYKLGVAPETPLVFCIDGVPIFKPRKLGFWAYESLSETDTGFSIRRYIPNAHFPSSRGGQGGALAMSEVLGHYWDLLKHPREAVGAPVAAPQGCDNLSS